MLRLVVYEHIATRNGAAALPCNAIARAATSNCDHQYVIELRDDIAIERS